jgi:hypothetical protein
MDWLLVSCCGMMAWVTLCVVAGERLRREQERKVAEHAAQQASPSAKSAEEPVVLSSPN